ncbi:MAG: DUF4010 domain-containing protein [Chromatiales bacterium]|jgi:uncharacterized membrane protein (DUF4010 family)|nr:DUF4010 domain-containing protein [Chromatiales bacterium]
MVAVPALREWLGVTGVRLLAVFSGVADVDAVNLSMSRLASEDLAVTVAEEAVLLAVLSNTLFKAALAVGVGSGAFARRVVVYMATSAGIGIAAWALW